MFFLIDFSYKQVGGYSCPTFTVRHSRAGGNPEVEITAALKCSRNAKVWIPACAGMTAEVSAKFAVPVFRRPFALMA